MNRMILHRTRNPIGPKKYAKTAVSAETKEESQAQSEPVHTALLFISDSVQMIVQVGQLKRKKEDESNDKVMKERRKGRREGLMLIFGQLEKNLPLSVASS
jgi:hypothetical protein